jgi:GTPase SAR1 family protein
MNLDPAVLTLPYGANIDIRDTVKYKEVMKQFNLGPNGGILTSLNLFATKFDEVKLAYYSLKLLFNIILYSWLCTG